MCRLKTPIPLYISLLSVKKKKSTKTLKHLQSSVCRKVYRQIFCTAADFSNGSGTKFISASRKKYQQVSKKETTAQLRLLNTLNWHPSMNAELFSAAHGTDFPRSGSEFSPADIKLMRLIFVTVMSVLLCCNYSESTAKTLSLLFISS